MANYSAQFTEGFNSDPFSGLFQPDVMLPSQFLGGADSGIGGGERRLMAALLADGVEAYIGRSLSQRIGESKHSEVQDWVESRDPGYVFSFDNVCTCLGIDPEYLRIGLARYVQTVRDKRAKGTKIDNVWKKIRRPRK